MPAAASDAGAAGTGPSSTVAACAYLPTVLRSIRSLSAITWIATPWSYISCTAAKWRRAFAARLP